MKIPYRYRPTLGFVVLVLSWALVAAFLWWGAQRPDLDVVWETCDYLRPGECRVLDADERAALERTLQRHPELGIRITEDGCAELTGTAEDEAEGGDGD
jgi:hypothetical protein